MQNIYPIKDRFVCAFLIAEDGGLTLVDTGTGGASKAILAKIAEIGRQPHDLKRILITHCDPDHVGSAAALKAATGAMIYASAQEAAAMRRGKPSRPFQGNAFTKALFGLMGSTIMKITPVAADELLAEGDVLPVLGGLHVLSTPGHTPDHISFYAPEIGALFVGDSMNAMGGKLQFLRGPVTWDYDVGMASVEKQAALGATTVYSGHGPVVAGEDVRFPVAVG